MASTPFVMDAAQYVIEPPDLWTSRVPAKLKDQAPKVVDMPDGGQGWSFNDGAWLRPLGLEVAAGHSPVDIKDHGYSYADIRQGMYDGKARLEDLRVDEIDAANIFPTYALDVRSIMDPELHIACVRAYNDALSEWTKAGDAKRLLPQAILPAVGLDAALDELKRVAKMGFNGIVFNGWPAGGDRPQDAEDAVWDLCAEAGIVINLLRGGPTIPDRTAVAPSRYVGKDATGVRAVDAPIELAWATTASIRNQNMAWFVLVGICERWENLKISMIDAGAGWITTTGELLDWNYRYAQFYGMNYRLKYVPSDYVKRNFHATIKGERFVVVAREDFGENTLMWSSNYPTSSSSFPTSRQAITEQMDGVPDDDQGRLVGLNCAEWYGVATPVVA
jgi:predicted TIM-barrel fold metal-dependent hydrolase